MADTTETPLSTRERMLEAAIEVLERDGEKAIRTRDISAAAGVQYSAVEYHFGGREGLIEAALLERYRREYAETLGQLRVAVEKCTTAAQFKETSIGVIRSYQVRDRFPARAVRAAVLGAATTRPTLARELVRVNNELFDEMASILEGPKQRGWMRKDVNLRMLAAFYMALINGRILVEFVEERDENRTWNQYVIEAALAVGFGEAPRVS